MENEERPHDYEAEEAVLCAILHDNKALDKLTLEPADFYDPQNGAIYKGMLELRNKGRGIDRVTVYDSVPHQGGVGSVLAELDDGAFSSTYASDYAEIIRGKRVKRRMLDQLPALRAKFLNGADPIQLLEAWREAGAALELPEAADADPSCSVSDILNAETEAQPWLLDGILGAGQLSILTGQPGGGKTTVAWHLVRAVIKGEPFIERDIQNGGVCFMAMEEGRDSVLGAYERMGIEEADQIRVLFGDEVRADPIGYLTRHIEMHRPSLIIADTMAQILRVENLNDYSEVSPKMAQLLDLCRKQRPDGTPRPHIMLLHHAGKSEGAVFLGSTAVQAACDLHWHLEKLDGGSDARILTAPKQRAGQDTFPRTILTMSDEGNLEVDTAPVTAVKRGMEQDVLTALESGPLMQTELFKSITGKTGDKSKTVIRLDQAGKIERTREGKGFKCSLKETSSSPSLLFPRGGEELNNAALPPSPPLRGEGERANEVEKMSILDERGKNEF